MDPLTISALIALAPTVAGMPWGEIFNGTKFTTDGWHGWTSAEKNAFMVDGIEKGFKFSKTKEGSNYSPRDYFWQMVQPFIFRDQEKTWQGFYEANKLSIDTFIAEPEKSNGFSFYEKAPVEAKLKELVSNVLENKTIIYGAIGLVLLWIVSLVVKMTKK